VWYGPDQLIDTSGVGMMNRRICQPLAFLAGLVFAAGAIGAEAPGVAIPATPESDPTFPKPAADADRYILGPGDVIQVFVWRNAELSTSVPVLPDGRVSTPLVDAIVASGKTPVQLARDIEAALAEYVRSPRVSVLVSSPQSTFSQVKLVGQVSNPQALPYRDGMTVMDAVLASGGLTPFAAGNRAKILRKAGGKEKEIPVKLKNLMEKGDMKQDLPLQPGDILIVPETFL
jgi:polysaccharide biosynthesis/export protein